MCQDSDSLQATAQGGETLLVSCELMIEWVMGRMDLNQCFHWPSPEVAAEGECTSYVSFQHISTLYLQGRTY